MASEDADEAALAEKFAVMRQILDERQWRVYLGTEARMLGYGGIAAVARASGVSQTDVVTVAVTDVGTLTTGVVRGLDRMREAFGRHAPAEGGA